MQINENTSLSKWLAVGILPLVGVGLLAIVGLHFSFNVPLNSLITPVCVLLAIQIASYVSMYWARRRFKRTQDMRLAVIVFGAYVIAFGLGGFYYAGKFGFPVRGQVSFSVLVAIVVVVTIAAVSKRKPTRP